MNVRWLCVTSGILLLLGIPTGWPYDFYIVLRWVIFASSIIVVYNFNKSRLKNWTLIFAVVALLFNPIIPIYLEKSTWIIFDLIGAILFFIAGYSSKNK